MNFSFDPDAQQELFDAALEYELAREGLGQEFSREMQRLIRQICEHPQRWPKYSPRTRRHRSRRFPYSVIYQVLDREIFVVAIAHAARRPGYWRSRRR